MNMTQTVTADLLYSASHQYNGFSKQLDVVLEQEISFPEGISAFEDYKNFTFRKEPRLKPFIYMHSSLDPEVSFVCVDPFILNPSYVIQFNGETYSKLDVQDMDDLIALCLVSVGRDMYTTTANLMSPILINARSLKAEQVIMEDAETELLRYNVWNSIGHASTSTNFNTKVN